MRFVHKVGTASPACPILCPLNIVSFGSNENGSILQVVSDVLLAKQSPLVVN